jgi:hypothetical protein
MKWLFGTILGLVIVLVFLIRKEYREVSAPLNIEAQPTKAILVSKKIKPLSIVGTRIVDSDGKDVVLKGVTTDEFRYNNIYKDMDDLKDRLSIAKSWGINLVVLYLQQPKKNLERVDEIVEISNWATANDMYTLIFPVVHQADEVPKKDIHLKKEEVHYSPLGNNTQNILDILSKKLSNNFGVLYGMGVEPHSVDLDKLYDQQMKLIGVVRKNSPNSVAVINGMVWGYLLEKYVAKPPPYPNILYDLHRYAANRDENIDMNRCRLPAEYVGKMPFILGEFGGVYSEGFGSNRDLECISNFLATLKDAHIGFAMHTLDYSSALGLVKENKKLSRKGKMYEKFLLENYRDN